MSAVRNDGAKDGLWSVGWRAHGGLREAGIGAERPAYRGESAALGSGGESVKSVKSVIRYLFPFSLRAYAFCGGWEGCVQGVGERAQKKGMENH